MGILEMIVSRTNTALVMKTGNDSEAAIGGALQNNIVEVTKGIYSNEEIITLHKP